MAYPVLPAAETAMGAAATAAVITVERCIARRMYGVIIVKYPGSDGERVIAVKQGNKKGQKSVQESKEIIQVQRVVVSWLIDAKECLLNI